MVLLGYNGFSIYGCISEKIWGQSFGFLDLSAFFFSKCHEKRLQSSYHTKLGIIVWFRYMMLSAKYKVDTRLPSKVIWQFQF